MIVLDHVLRYFQQRLWEPSVTYPCEKRLSVTVGIVDLVAGESVSITELG